MFSCLARRIGRARHNFHGTTLYVQVIVAMILACLLAVAAIVLGQVR